MLSGGMYSDVIEAASRVATNACTVAHRWHVYMDSLRMFAEREVPSYRIKVPK
jgi:hypothetical protein